MTFSIRAHARVFVALSLACLGAVAAPLAAAQQLSIADAAVTEGNSGTKLLTFTVTASATSPTAMRFDVATSNGTATAGSDYVAFANTGLRIPIGSTSKTFSITINGDTTVEGNETFALNLANPVGATISDGQAIGTITNDDAAAGPTLSVQDVEVEEGSADSRQALVLVSLSKASTEDVVFNLATSDGSATASSDYQALNLSGQRILAGQTSASFPVTIVGDAVTEPAEYFQVDASNVAGATVLDGSAKVTIVNDDLPTLSVSDVTIVEGGGWNTDMVFRFELSAPSTSPVTFDISNLDGTATGGSDFETNNWPGMTIPPGTTTKDFRISTRGDSAWEPDEYFTIKVSRLSGASMPVSQAVGTIINDDPKPGPTVSIADVSVAEGGPGDQSVRVTVSLSEPADTYVGLDLHTSNGSVDQFDMPESDYRGLFIAPGQTGTAFDVPIYGDDYYELDETFFLDIDSVTGHAQLGDGHAVVTLLNDDAPGLTIDDVALVEGNSGTQAAVFTVKLPAPATSPVTFDIATSDGTATAGSDYVGLSLAGQSIPTGQSSKSFSVPIIGDTVAEKWETFSVNLSNVSGASVSKGTATGIIGTDDGLPNMIEILDASVSEGDTGTVLLTFWIYRYGDASGSVQYDIATSDGSATAGSDYVAESRTAQTMAPGQTSATFVVQVQPDAAVEADETFSVKLSNVVGVQATKPTAIGSIRNDDPAAPTLTMSDVWVNEGNSGTTTAIFTATLSKASASDTTLSIVPAGVTATLGSDFHLDTTEFTIPAGSWFARIEVKIHGDEIYESSETFSLSLANVSANVVVAKGQGIGTITDNDASHMPSLSISDASVVEGNSGSTQMSFQATLSSASEIPVCFTMEIVGGTATAGSDYTDDTGNVCIPAGQSSTGFDIAVLGDTVAEPDEFVLLAATGVTWATAPDRASSGRIINDETGPLPTISIGDVSIVEGNEWSKPASFVVTLSSPSAQPVLFEVATAGGTATTDADFLSLSYHSFSIMPGETSAVVSVPIFGDLLREPDESFTVNLSNAVGATVADGSAIGTITNDDSGGIVSIGDVSIVEGNANTRTMTFTVSLASAVSTAVTYDIATANGTAVAPADYASKALTGQSIPAGALSKTFTVSINGDTLVEPNESFQVNLTNVVGATALDDLAIGTITNDDSGGGGTPTLTIADVSLAEGNSLSKQMTFTVKLSAAATGPVTYSIATANGTAVAPGDYTAKSLTGQSIAAGATSKTFTVAIKGDRVVEPNETFKVNVTAVTGATLGDGQATGTITNDDAAAVRIARFDVGDVVDDVDDGHREPVLSTREYASLLAEGAKSMCRRASNATVIAVDGVENRQVLADLAAAANALCTNKPQYDAVMTDSGSRGFLIAAPAKGAAAITVLGKPETSAQARSTTLSVLVPGLAQPVTLVLADGASKSLAAQLQLRAEAQPTEALVLLGAKAMAGLVDLTARTQAKPGVALPDERILVNAALLKQYRQPGIELTPLPAEEPPAQMLELQ